MLIRCLLLAPGEQRTFNQTPAYAFSGGDIIVTFDSAGQAQKIAGRRLLRDRQAVLAVGQAEQAVTAALGQGYVIERNSPKTQGVFMAGSALAWVEHYYHDGATRFLIITDRNNLISSIQCAPVEKLPLPER